MNSSSYLDRPLLPLALPRMPEKIQAELVAAPPTEKRSCVVGKGRFCRRRSSKIAAAGVRTGTFSSVGVTWITVCSGF